MTVRPTPGGRRSATDAPVGRTLAPVFVVGCPRSGTTLLRQLLRTHPEVEIAPETHFVRRFWLRAREYGDLTSDANLSRLLDDVCETPAAVEMGVGRGDLRAAMAAYPRTMPGVLAAWLTSFQRATGAGIVGEKTPNHLLYMQRLSAALPTALFVHIHRDPRAVAASWRDLPWSTGSLAGDADVWVRYVRSARRKPPTDASRLCVVGYEDLVTSPEAVLARVFRFVGVDPGPAGRAAQRLSGSDGIDADAEPWKARAVRVLDPGRADRWRGVLAPAEVRQVEAAALREMRVLGYEPDAPAGRLAAVAVGAAIRRGLRQANYHTRQAGRRARSALAAGR